MAHHTPDDRLCVKTARIEIIKFSIIFISTNITPIKAALDLLKSLKSKEISNYIKILKKEKKKKKKKI